VNKADGNGKAVRDRRQWLWDRSTPFSNMISGHHYRARRSSREIYKEVVSCKFLAWNLEPSRESKVPPMVPLSVPIVSFELLHFLAHNTSIRGGKCLFSGREPPFSRLFARQNAVRRYGVAPGHIDSCRFCSVTASPRHSRRCFRKRRVKCSERAVSIDGSLRIFLLAVGPFLVLRAD
jgi:hypothetical protein